MVAVQTSRKPSAHGIRNRASRPITLSGTETEKMILRIEFDIKTESN